MTISVNWSTKVIYVPKVDTILIQSVPSEIRQLDINVFRLILKDIEDDEGMPFLDTHRHNTTVTVGGAILARVVEIINGYTITFEDGLYAVNLVGANSNIGDVVNVNQVSIRSSNSAGLQDLNSLQAASFGGGVAINTSSSYTGKIFPVGTRQYPVNNLTDCLEIATERGLKTIFVASDLNIATTNFSSGITFRGENVNIHVTIQSSANINNCEFTLLTLDGYLDNNNLLRECAVGDIYHVNGFMFQCGLYGTVWVQEAQCAILDCYSIVPDGYNIPIFDLTNATNNIVIRSFSGHMSLRNCTTPIDASISINGGTIFLNNTITNGTFSIHGTGDVGNDSTGVAVVSDGTVGSLTSALTWNRPTNTFSIPGSMGEKIRKNLIR